MFFTRALMIVYKTTGGRAWNPPEGLRPLSPCQTRNRRKNAEITLKNISVLKMAAASEPEQPTRLYKPLNHWRVMLMRKKMEQSKEVLAWNAGDSSIKAVQIKLKALSARLRLPLSGGRMPEAAQAKLP